MIFPFKEKIWWIPLFCLQRQDVSAVADRAHISTNKNENLIKTYYQILVSDCICQYFIFNIIALPSKKYKYYSNGQQTIAGGRITARRLQYDAVKP
jgi:hypothetical protein